MHHPGEVATHPSVDLTAEANPGPVQNAPSATGPWRSRLLQTEDSSAASPVMPLLLLLHLVALGKKRVCHVVFEGGWVVWAAPAVAAARAVAAVHFVRAAAFHTASAAAAVGVRPPAAREWLCR